jgi:hypothetical protein
MPGSGQWSPQPPAVPSAVCHRYPPDDVADPLGDAAEEGAGNGADPDILGSRAHDRPVPSRGADRVLPRVQATDWHRAGDGWTWFTCHPQPTGPMTGTDDTEEGS